jgi:hypothetical protein
MESPADKLLRQVSARGGKNRCRWMERWFGFPRVMGLRALLCCSKQLRATALQWQLLYNVEQLSSTVCCIPIVPTNLVVFANQGRWLRKILRINCCVRRLQLVAKTAAVGWNVGLVIHV